MQEWFEHWLHSCCPPSQSSVVNYLGGGGGGRQQSSSYKKGKSFPGEGGPRPPSGSRPTRASPPALACGARPPPWPPAARTGQRGAEQVWRAAMAGAQAAPGANKGFGGKVGAKHITMRFVITSLSLSPPPTLGGPTLLPPASALAPWLHIAHHRIHHYILHITSYIVSLSPLYPSGGS